MEEARSLGIDRGHLGTTSVSGVRGHAPGGMLDFPWGDVLCFEECLIASGGTSGVQRNARLRRRGTSWAGGNGRLPPGGTSCDWGEGSCRAGGRRCAWSGVRFPEGGRCARGGMLACAGGRSVRGRECVKTSGGIGSGRVGLGCELGSLASGPWGRVASSGDGGYWAGGGGSRWGRAVGRCPSARLGGLGAEQTGGFNGRLRDDYNIQHPEGSLGCQTPSAFAALWKEEKSEDASKTAT